MYAVSPYGLCMYVRRSSKNEVSEEDTMVSQEEEVIYGRKFLKNFTKYNTELIYYFG